MQHPASHDTGRNIFPRSRTFGTAAATGRQQLAWIWSRESLLRLLLSLVLALALWLYINNKQNPSVAQDFGQALPVSVANLPDGMVVPNNNLGYVYVRIKRTDRNTPVSLDSFHAFVNLLGVKPGVHQVPVQVIADPGIDVVQKKPATIPVELQPIQSQRVRVLANVISHPPSGYGYDIKIGPSSVVVSGPKSLVSQVARATFDLDLARLRTNIDAMYTVLPENSQGGLVTGRLRLAPSQVHVVVNIRALSSYKTLPVLAQVEGRAATGYGVVSLISQPAEITVTGSPQRLSRISTAATVVSIAHRKGGAFTSRARVKLPKDVSSRTKYVTVHVQLAPVQSSSSISTAVTPLGVTSGLIVKTKPAQVVTTVFGPSTALRSAGSRIRAVVNLTGYGPGTYTLRPTVTSNGSLHVGAFYPSTVTVTLLPAGSG